MAIWQFDLFLIPKQRLAQLECVGSLSEDVYQQNEGWDDSISSERVARHIDAMLERGQSWLQGQLTWGTEDGYRIDLLLAGDVISELMIRLDMRSINQRILQEVIELANFVDAMFCTDDGTLIEAEMETLIEVIARSDAARYVAAPQEFIERLNEL